MIANVEMIKEPSNFDIAIESLKRGFAVRRGKWEERTRLVFDPLHGELQMGMEGGRLPFLPFLLSWEDIAATDWVVM